MQEKLENYNCSLLLKKALSNPLKNEKIYFVENFVDSWNQDLRNHVMNLFLGANSMETCLMPFSRLDHYILLPNQRH